MKIVFDSDNLVPCNDKGHRPTTYIIEGTHDDWGVPALIINCKECGHIFDSAEEYHRAADWWFILQ